MGSQGRFLADTDKELHAERKRLECEARYWILWVKKNGREAWRIQKKKIERRRGVDSVNKLVDAMNTERRQAFNTKNSINV